MKRLLVALCILAPLGAQAQTTQNTIYKPISPSSVQFISNSALAITHGFASQFIRIVCTVSCFLNFRVSGVTVPATLATGIFIPPNASELMGIVRNSTISIIGNVSAGSAGGSIYVNEVGP